MSVREESGGVGWLLRVEAEREKASRASHPFLSARRYAFSLPPIRVAVRAFMPSVPLRRYRRVGRRAKRLLARVFVERHGFQPLFGLR